MLKCLLLIFTAAVLWSSCASDTQPRFTVLQSLRVIELGLDSPEINFDGTSFSPNSVSLTPWISDLYGHGRPLLQSLYFCLDPGIGVGATATCAGNPTRTEVVTNQAVSPTSTFLAPNYTGALGTLLVPLTLISPVARTALSQFYASETTAQRYNGYALLVFYEVYPTGNEPAKVTSFKRLIFSDASKPTKNLNPAGLEIRKNGAELTSLPATRTTDFFAFLPAASHENYTRLSPDGTSAPLTETLETNWFLTGNEDIPCSKKTDCTSDGLFSFEITREAEPNIFDPPAGTSPVSRGRVFIAVVRDGRGGSMVKRYCDGTCP